VRERPPTAEVDPLDGPGRWHHVDVILSLGSFFLTGALVLAYAIVHDEEWARDGLIGRLFLSLYAVIPVLLVLIGIAVTPIVWVGERGLVRSTLGVRLLALVLPCLARRLEARFPLDGLTSVVTEESRNALGELSSSCLRFTYATGRVLRLGTDVARQAVKARVEAHLAANPPPVPAPARVQVERRELADGGVCPYCKDGVADGPGARACPACRVVHHAECLTSHGGCSTLGCAEGPRSAPPERAQA
jgi:hypothetical protein